jgi:large subunit ribosomal protein L34
MSKTYQPKKRKRARTHGFLVRSRTKTGRNTILRRRRKGRKAITTVSK